MEGTPNLHGIQEVSLFIRVIPWMSLLNGHLGLVLMRNRGRVSSTIVVQYVARLRWHFAAFPSGIWSLSRLMLRSLITLSP